MGKRKLIGFIAANSESVFQQRMTDGILDQCKKYGYDCAVFSPLIKDEPVFDKYLDGELNLLELINFDKLDGLIVASFSLTIGDAAWVKDSVARMIASKCKKPVVSLGLPMNDYPFVCADDRSSFVEITDHILDVHKCSDILFIAGPEGNTASDDRIAGFKDSMEKHGFTVPDENIVYGNFWYDMGERIANEIISGQRKRHRAIICVNDYTAVGLINKLVANGIKVPDDIIVTGFDATIETIVNNVTITSFIPAAAQAAAEAVNVLTGMMDPEAEIIPITRNSSGLKPGVSCGCPEDLEYIKNRFLYMYSSDAHYGSNKITGTSDISDFLESYMLEDVTSSESVEECIERIALSTSLLKPFEKYYLCLGENWTDTDRCTVKGYPNIMDIVIEEVYSENGESVNLASGASGKSFDTSLMLPQMYEEREEPRVFYFLPVHFRESAVGYAVLQCSEGQRKIDAVFRNWLRNVNTALELKRAEKRLTIFSERDAMTGLYNRRGMEAHVKELIAKASSHDSWIVFVIDMDGLKHINDTYGHTEGDYGIAAVASAARQMARSSEICVRAGGDEFYVIGLGDYHQIDAIVRAEKFKEALAEENKAEKPYEITASIGFCCEPYSSGVDINDLINISDGRMYANKVARKKQR